MDFIEDFCEKIVNYLNKFKNLMLHDYKNKLDV